MSHYSGAGDKHPTHYLKQALDEKLYNLSENEIDFFKQQTGIRDNAELKQHIIEVQTKAYAVYPYPCIRRFGFASLKISRIFAYQELLNLGKTRDEPIFLDIGCCFGNDIRKAAADGYPIESIIASDLHKEFWALGHELFKTNPDTYPVPFIEGDAFKPDHLAIVPPFTAANPPKTPKPDLKTLTSLNPLQGHTSAIHASAFFHLFLEDDQLRLGRALAGLLSPEPGSMILGEHGGMPVKGYRALADPDARGMFCHSPESWKELWDGNIFEKGTVKVESTLKRVDRSDVANLMAPGTEFYMFAWCVTRL